MITIKAQDLSVSIQKNEILKGINFQADNDKITAILGPNGSGKSTLLKTLYRFITPSSGTIYYKNIDINTIPLKEYAKEISVVSQFQNFQFDYNVLEYVLLGRTPHKKSFQTDDSNDLEIAFNSLKKVNMESFYKRSIGSLSGGEKQRVALATALAQEPKLLIMDEPSNHLDIRYQIQIMELIKSLDITTIISIHDLVLTSQYCDYVYILKDGHVIRHGEPLANINEEIIKEVYDINCKVYKIDGSLFIKYSK